MYCKKLLIFFFLLACNFSFATEDSDKPVPPRPVATNPELAAAMKAGGGGGAGTGAASGIPASEEERYAALLEKMEPSGPPQPQIFVHCTDKETASAFKMLKEVVFEFTVMSFLPENFQLGLNLINNKVEKREFPKGDGLRLKCWMEMSTFDYRNDAWKLCYIKKSLHGTPYTGLYRMQIGVLHEFKMTSIAKSGDENVLINYSAQVSPEAWVFSKNAGHVQAEGMPTLLAVDLSVKGGKWDFQPSLLNPARQLLFGEKVTSNAAEEIKRQILRTKLKAALARRKHS